MDFKVIFGAEKNYCSRIGYAFSQVDPNGLKLVFCSDKQQILDSLTDADAVVVRETIGITHEEIENRVGKRLPILKLVASNIAEPDEICMFQGASLMIQDICTKINAASEQSGQAFAEPEPELEPELCAEPFIERPEERPETKDESVELCDDRMTLRMELFEQLYASDLKTLPPIRLPETESQTEPVEPKKETRVETADQPLETEEVPEPVDPSRVILFTSAKGGSGNSAGACAAAKNLAANGEKVLFLDLSVPGAAEGFERQELQKTEEGVDYLADGAVMIAKPQADILRNWLAERGPARGLRELADASACTKVILDMTCTYDAFSEAVFANAGTIVYTCDGTLSGISKHASLEQAVEAWEGVRTVKAQKWFFYNRFTMEGARIESAIPNIGGIMMEDEDAGIAAFSDQFARKSFWKKLI